MARRPFLFEALSEGLINTSALARKLKPEIEGHLGRSVQTGAVAMALKRMQIGPIEAQKKPLQRFFERLTDISVRSGVSGYTYTNTAGLLGKQARLLDVLSESPTSFHTFSRGVSETTILISDDLAPQLEELFAEEQLQDRETHLASITLLLPQENRSLYGVYYHILKALAWNAINIIEIISTSNEFSLIVREEDVDQAFSILLKLRHS